MKNILKKLGEKMADGITEYCGSWSFVIWFLFISTVYMTINQLIKHSIDPWPFPGLNLMLGFISSLTAPFVMMSTSSQDRKKKKQFDEDLRIDKDINHRVKQIEIDIKEILKKIEER